MNKNLDKQLAQVFENDYCGYECFVEKVINVIFTDDDTYEAFQSAEDLTTDEKRRRKANESGILKILKVGEIDAPVPIEVFDITLKDDKDLQYNRVGIQSFIRSDLFMFTNAFMLFHNENPEGKDWRFSFAYKDTTIKGMTPAKRYTYLFGKNHRARTASERFAKLADAEKDTQNLLNAFSVEALSKDFFNGYKEQYKAFCDFLFAHKDDREYFGPKFSQWEDKYLRDYVKKMMGRITFIYFLQRKGWMNNDLDYMQKAFENSTCKDDYLDSFLEPLFCGVLNTKPEERAELFKSLGWNLSLLDGWNDIPYLNGGLFERDEQDKPKSKFPAQMFKNLFDFYSRYNFTIYENDPDDAEVGIDPEMLGHIFENLLEDNKDKGAFYTPKEIVQYMSRESIAQYLKTHADEALHTAIDELIKDGKVGEALQDKANATAIYRLLCDVKVCDPAIGSGAFPMGVLNVLYHARMLLYAFTRPTQGFSPAMVKREIIQNNIYGVDIEKGAVDIARLRFWLALVVDEEEPQPLPNLDYKIMCGNSLIHRFALDAPFKDVLKHYNKENKTNFTLDDYRQWVYDYTNLSDHTQKDNFRQKIEEIKSAFKTELSKGEKLKLSDVRGEIDNLQAKDIFGKQVGSATEIKKMQKKLKDLEAQRDDINNNKLYENAFEWRFEFPALLNEEGNFTGFDVVIANPPFGVLFSEEEKKYISKHYQHQDYQPESYLIFIEKGINIMKKQGVLSYIIPNTWLLNLTTKKIRRYIFESTSLVEIVHLKDYVFNAIVDTEIVSLINKEPLDEKIRLDVKSSKGELMESSYINQNDLILKQGEAVSLFIKNDYLSLVNKLTSFKKLDYYCKITQGTKPFQVGKGVPKQTREDVERKEFISVIPQKGFRPLLRGNLMNRYKILWNNNYWIKYGEWLAEPRPSANYDAPEKIIIRQTGDSLVATIDKEQFIVRDNLYTCIGKSSDVSLSTILGQINSKVLNWYYQKVLNPEEGEALAQVKRGHLIQLPIASEQDCQLETLVTQMLEGNGTDKLIEREIDIAVYRLYGLTYDEVLIVDPETEVTREEYEKN